MSQMCFFLLYFVSYNKNIYYTRNKLHLLSRKHMTFPGFRNTLVIFAHVS